LHGEGLAVAAVAAWVFVAEQEWSWALLAVLFLAPDLSLAGFLVGKRAGAIIYDLAHNYVLAGLLTLAGLWSGQDVLLGAGLVLATHVGADRLMGYGLKIPGEEFKHTHLQALGALRQRAAAR
jgi:hypothetical protein